MQYEPAAEAARPRLGDNSQQHLKWLSKNVEIYQMGETIRTWMRVRLGVIIDLSPNIFGHYARDGTLLAKLLHSYDIINDNQLSTLTQTQDPALARVNLKNLRIWLRFIGVDCDDKCIEDISNGKGTSSLRLFYKVYLCLENKDRLHFITLQKEREKFIPNSAKFDVTTVLEEPEHLELKDHPFAAPLKKSGSLIKWHRLRRRELIESCKKEREKFRTSQYHDGLLKSSPTEKKISFPTRTPRSIIEETEKRDLDEFAKKHKVKKSKQEPDVCKDARKTSVDKVKPHRVDHEAAKAFTKSLKSKYRQEAMTKNFKTRMQKQLLSELWDKVQKDQEMQFDEILAGKILKQSQYEKQLMRKLTDIRSYKTRMADNRLIVGELFQNMRENEAVLELERAREVLVRESEEVEAETKRMKELERKIHEQTAQRRLKKLEKIGEDIVSNLIDISVKAAEYKIASSDDCIPKSLWNEWKALFIKNQPIWEVNPPKLSRDSSEFQGEQEIIDETDETDSTRIDLLNDDDFDNYHNIRSPWNEFSPNIDTETQKFLDHGIIVLGYVVHKLLKGFQPHLEEAMVTPLPNMKTRAVVLDLPDSVLYEPIQELLKCQRIHLVRMENAINYCLEAYKIEMKDFDYIDLNIKAATKEALLGNSLSSAGGSNAGWIQKKEIKSASTRARTASSIQGTQTAKGLNKLTQTPRVIPYEDMNPSLSNAAYIGKWTYEFLTLGQPLSDDLNARILVEYLKTLEDAQGFVLVKYPNTFQEMACLELALTGRRLLDKVHADFIRKKDNTIEEIDPVHSRISFESEESDGSSWRTSRLVPNPTKRLQESNEKTFFTVYIRIKPKQMENDDKSYEILQEDATSLDAFYVDQEIAWVFYYSIFNLDTLKKLARLIITGDNARTFRIDSQELFGEDLDYFKGRQNVSPSLNETAIVKQLILRSRESLLGESECSSWSERSEEKVMTSISIRTKDTPIVPGDPEWSWAKVSQPRPLIESLTNLWKNLETSYIENLKDMFYLKRTNFGAIAPYSGLVKKHMKDFVERPDEKQDLLHEFHRAFNDVEEEIRDDVDVKHELHCRVADFQTQLWEICDVRRRQNEEEWKKIILDNWTSLEAMVLTNVYIGIVQAEIDRYVHTVQIIQDYYLSMLQRHLQGARQSPVVLKRIPLGIQSSRSREEIASAENTPKSAKEPKVRVSTAKIHAAPSPPDENIFKEEIVKFLTNIDQEDFIIEKMICYKSIDANIQYVTNVLEAIASSALDIVKKEEIIGVNSQGQVKEKKRSSRKISETPKIELEDSRKRLQDLVSEWRYGLMFEINRLRMRLKMLQAAARADVQFLMDNMRRVFVWIHKNIIDRYKKEIKSMNEMASNLRFAIEEAKPIQEELLLDGDQFIVRSNVLMFPNKPEPPPTANHEEICPIRFQIAQLSRLMDIFHRVAPSGTLPERSFVYILQDLIVCSAEEGGAPPLPSNWYELRSCDVPKIVNEVFGNVQFIDWREFIIYAVDVDMPTVDQLLIALKAFRVLDKRSKDVIAVEDFYSVQLWFSDWNDIETTGTSLMHNEDFARDEKEMCEEETSALRTNKSIGTSYMKPEDLMRLKLTKELLCEMFLSECETVHYLAFLMAFCKDEDPVRGLGKAVSLAMGKKVCMEWNEGEKYAEKIRRTIVTEANRKSLLAEATQVIFLFFLIGYNEEKAQIEFAYCFLILFSSILERILESIVHVGEAEYDTILSKGTKEKLSLEKNNSDLFLGHRDWNDRNTTREEIETNRLSISKAEPELETVYWLSLNLCQSVLAAMLPRHANNPDLLETGKTLREILKIIFKDLKSEEVISEPDVVLAHRFLHHDLVKKLLEDTSKFTTKRLGNILKKILKQAS